MEIKLGYGNTDVCVSIKDENLLGLLHSNELKETVNESKELERAMKNPIGLPQLKEIVGSNDTIAIVTSDITRPMPSKKVLPFVLKELEEAKVKKENITIVFALGSHRDHTKEEMISLVGEKVYNEYTCIDSNMNDYVHMGDTTSGTPVDIFTPVAKADKRICLGNIEYHYFAGYSGGSKAIMPGVSTRAAIQANHSRMVDSKSCAGNIDTNPVRQDIEEVAEFISIDYIVNVVLDENKNIVKAVAGHHVQAHREGCQFLDSLYKVPIEKKADIVVVSAGGFPKDINIYQAQKALDNAKYAVKQGGTVILVASCSEGYGEGVFEKWLQEAKQPKDLIERVERHFELGGHKAAAIAMVREKNNIYLVSDLDDAMVEQAFMQPFSTVQEAYDTALAAIGEKAEVLVIAHGGSIIAELVEF